MELYPKDNHLHVVVVINLRSILKSNSKKLAAEKAEELNVTTNASKSFKQSPQDLDFLERNSHQYILEIHDAQMFIGNV
uniref:Uncharacterized protein n=1 Tax=Romanomermis culicivorax TaxID=13658 RepID=A0A915J1Y9_ROMCU